VPERQFADAAARLSVCDHRAAIFRPSARTHVVVLPCAEALTDKPGCWAIAEVSLECRALRLLQMAQEDFRRRHVDEGNPFPGGQQGCASWIAVSPDDSDDRHHGVASNDVNASGFGEMADLIADLGREYTDYVSGIEWWQI
jgi:hypothetical protein